MQVSIRPMGIKDIPQGYRLSSLAGWNQSVNDWHWLLNAGNGGCFVAYSGEVILGTVTSITYAGKISWIGMVLVDPDFRKMGIGTRLVKTAVQYSLTNSRQVYLDATPQGSQLYIRLGFQPIVRLQRLVLEHKEAKRTKFLECKSLLSDLSKEVVAFDEKVYGANREPLIKYLLEGYPQLAWYISKKHKLTGLCLGRQGRLYTHIGPLEAVDEDCARILVLQVVSQAGNRDVILDIFEANQTWLQWLLSNGFIYQRPFIRMSLEAQTDFGLPSRRYASAGPEFG